MEPNSNPNQMNPNTEMTKKEAPLGPVIGAIIVLAIILLGGFYFWGKRNDQNVNGIPESQQQSETQAIENQSSSDDVNSLQNDLNNTNVDVNGELNAS